MKLNWGNSIALVMLAFIAFIVGLILLLPGGEDKLRDPDYYEKGLTHDAQIQKEKNAQPYRDQVSIQYASGHLIVDFPDSQKITNIRVQMIKPNRSEYDFNVQSQELIDSSGIKANVLRHLRVMPSGLWKSRITWETDSLGFYVEEDLFIP